MFAHYYNHKVKRLEKLPMFEQFKTDIKIYLETLSKNKNVQYKAVQTMQ